MTADAPARPGSRRRPVAGIGSFAFGWAAAHGTPPLDEHSLLAFAREHGITLVQLGDNLPVHEWSAERLGRFVEASRDAGIGVELGARGLTEEHLRRYLDLCRVLRATLLRFVPDAQSYQPTVDELVALLRNAAAALAAAGVTLAIENHDRFPAAALRHIVEEAGTRHVGVCLDTANSLGAGEGLAAVTDILAPLTVNVHVKDVAIRRLPHLMGFHIEGRALGDGQLSIRDTLERVASYGRCGSVILEGWTPLGTMMEETIARERADAAVGIERLKRWVETYDEQRTGP